MQVHQHKQESTDVTLGRRIEFTSARRKERLICRTAILPRCYTQVSPNPIHLAWMVNKFDWLEMMSSKRKDPIRLVRMVNEFYRESLSESRPQTSSPM